MRDYDSRLKPVARVLRSNMTDAERKLWVRLRRKQMAGVQFYRQKTLGKFIVDFWCPKANLIIEVDGSQHFTDEGQEADEARAAFLGKQRQRILRFTNHEVLSQTEAVLQVIFNAVHQIHPCPPLPKGGTEQSSRPSPPGPGGIFSGSSL